ncbi:MAG: type II toxin-antitoxin system RelE/ParE family toxin [Candidatus Brockarchaeota archaeon]|nr:type II toxin-antitoxin system RelE/ParE family toxin [Candidatus Brockarchaeota archaeon]
MEWKIRIHRRALKFLDEIPEEERKLVEDKLNNLLKNLESGTLLHTRLDVKKLKGTWEGFLRLRVGKIRVIFKIEIENKEVLIYNIHYRGQAYRN